MEESINSLFALIIVFAFSCLGWYLIAFLNGDAFPKVLTCTKKYVSIPIQIGMLIFGMIGRNFHSYMDHYNDNWASYIRMCCLVIILCRGGCELTLKGKGLTALMLTFLPQLCEATTASLVSYGVYKMPIFVCFSLGAVVGAVSPGIIVPLCMYFQDQGYGVDKGIPTTLIAATSFDNIVAIMLFGIFSSLAFSDVGTTTISPLISILTNIYQIAAGVVIGLIVGAIVGVSLKRLAKWMILKLIVILCVLALFITSSVLTKFSQSLYIGTLMFGYMLNILWKQDKPKVHLAFIWRYLQPLLLGSIGAAIKISSLNFSYIPKALAILAACMVIRAIVAYICVWRKKFSFKERVVIACGWMPKATVQAAIGGIMLDKARNEIPDSSSYKQDYIDYGNIILTQAVITILITTPIGAVLVNSFGVKWLTKKGDDPKVSPSEDKNASGDSKEIENSKEQENDEEDKVENDVQNTNQAIIPEQNISSKFEENIPQDVLFSENLSRPTSDPQINDHHRAEQYPSSILPDIHKRNREINQFDS